MCGRKYIYNTCCTLTHVFASITFALRFVGIERTLLCSFSVRGLARQMQRSYEAAVWIWCERVALHAQAIDRIQVGAPP